MDGPLLILAIEDIFRIRIREQAAQVETVGELHELVVSRLGGRYSESCLTSSAFYRLRRGIMDVLHISRRAIKPSTRLDTILPRAVRREKWKTIQASTGLTFPDLEMPAGIQSGLLVLGIGSVGTVVFTALNLPFVPRLLTAFSLGGFAGLFLAGISSKYALDFPSRDPSVGELAKDLLALNYARVAGEVGNARPKQIWEILCRLITVQTGVEKSRITPEARIVADLNIR